MRASRTTRAHPAVRGREQGTSLVEFALIVPLFVLALFGLFDLGRAVYTQHTLAQAAREASRVAVVSPAATSTKYTAIRNAALAAAPAVALQASDVTGSGCADCFYPDGTVTGGRVVVNVSARIAFVTPIVSNLVGGDVTVTAESVRYLP